MGVFAEWQPRYAEHGIATFPVRDKLPSITGYLRTGLLASRQLVTKFPEADAFGFACRSARITVLDVDAPDDEMLADALSEFGQTPFVVRSGSGNYQAWYRNNGERRQIRPDSSRPIDILGGGYVVAPPSKATRGAYEIIQGSLEDLDRLPPLRAGNVSQTASAFAPIEKGGRNEKLWRECMKQAGACLSADQLMEFATQANRTMFREPLLEAEVQRIVRSAWKKEQSGENWFARGERVAVSADEIDGLLSSDPDAFILKLKLRRHHWGRTFCVANAMAATMPGGGWTTKRFAAARRLLEDLGELEMIRPASRHSGPAVYCLKGSQN